MADVVESDSRLCTQTLLALQLLALVGNFLCLLLSVHNVERVACRRCAIKTEYNCRLRRACLLNALVTLVEHRLYASMACSGYHYVAHLQCSVRHEHRRNVATALVERRLYDGTCRLAVRISLQIEHLRLKEHLLKQFLHSETLLCRYFLTLVLSSPFLHEEVHVCQVLTYLVGICSRFVNLVYGKYHRHVGCLCVGYCLTRGRHHAVVGGDDDDCDVRNLCSTGTHGCERLVTWGVEECYLTSVAECNVVCTDVLCDTACLSGNDI